MNKRVVTIKDVAKRADVSISTVSRVINGLDRVSPLTKEKVEKTIRELDFVPNNIAKSMITKKSKMIAVVVPELTNEFYIDVILGIEMIAKGYEYHLMIFSAENSEQNEINMASSAFEKMADGIIVIPTVHNLDIYSHFGKRIVLVDRYIPSVNINAIVIDNFGGANMMTNYLISKGHKKIGLICGDEMFNNGQERKAGYITSIINHDIKIVDAYIYSGNWDEKCGYSGIEHLMCLDDKPTAVFCCNNRIGIGAIQYLSDHSIEIGKEISLACFDDHRFARFVKPAITVVERPTIDMGICAATKLFDLMQGKNNETFSTTTSFGVKIIERGSVVDLTEK